jgi:hypothetical protein
MRKQLLVIFVLAAVMTGFSFGTPGLHVRFENVSGLVAKDRVLFDGAAIGSVEKITYGDDGIFTVSLSIGHDFKEFLTEYSRFVITGNPRDSDRKAVEMILIRMGGDPLKENATVEGSGRYQVLLEMMQDDAREGVEFLQKEVQRFSRDLKSLSEHEKVKELKEQMVRLEKELKKTTRETREKITAEIIPMLEKEIQELREELEALGREDEVEPLEKELEKIKYI